MTSLVFLKLQEILISINILSLNILKEKDPVICNLKIILIYFQEKITGINLQDKKQNKKQIKQ